MAPDMDGGVERSTKHSAAFDINFPACICTASEQRLHKRLFWWRPGRPEIFCVRQTIGMHKRTTLRQLIQCN